jgi:hypothetical protein
VRSLRREIRTSHRIDHHARQLRARSPPAAIARIGMTRLLSGIALAVGPITTLGLQYTVGLVPLSPAMFIVTALYAVVAIAAAVTGAVGFRAPADPVHTPLDSSRGKDSPLPAPVGVAVE